MSEPGREAVRPAKHLRLALVLNGGVSLAVWIGGVVHEVDRLRRCLDDDQVCPRETEGYRRALIEHGVENVRVDVIAGASAGGINGALLGAAIQGRKRLRDPEGRSLRDVWLELGELKALTRSTRDPDPPSLLRGDEYFLPALETVLAGLLAPASDPPLDHPLHVSLTATDLRARRIAAFATSDGTIEEPDPRVVFRFSARAGGEDPVFPDGATPGEGDVPGKGEMAERLPLDADHLKRLARAARSTSSFPAAFPPHAAPLRRHGDPAGKLEPTYLADGGILDNQPFSPVLDRISLMKVTERWRRVLLYVVPYVTETTSGPGSRRSGAPPRLMEVIGASGLARDLARLTSLQRVESARQEALTANCVQDVLHDEASLSEAAGALYAVYRRVQAQELRATAEEWRSSPRSVGTGQHGGDPDHADRQVRIGADPRQAPLSRQELRLLAPLLPPEDDWEGAARRWFDDQGEWCWGLTKAERFSRTVLRWLRDAPDGTADDARRQASELNLIIRQAMAKRRERFYATTGYERDPLAAFVASHAEITDDLKAVQNRITTLMAAVPGGRFRQPADVFPRLAEVEVVSNAAGTRPQAPPPFDFYRVSAREPVLDDAEPDRPAAGDEAERPPTVLGHRARTPEAKLAGMLVGHFAAFMKHSWRANDWMWGRLDGVTWMGRVLFERDDADARNAWVKREQWKILREELPALARAVDRDEREGFSPTAELALWRHENREQLDRLTREVATDPHGPEGYEPRDDDPIVAVFRRCELRPDRIGEESGSRAGVVTVTRLAAVASRAFSGAGSDLPGPVRGVIGATRRTTGLVNSLAVTFARAPAVGVALVFVLAAFAVALFVSEAGLAWLTPALVAAALLLAWSTYGWISTPPTSVRFLVLLALLGLLAWAALATLELPNDAERPALTFVAAAAAAAGLGLLVAYRASKRSWARAGVGYAMLALLAATLLDLGLARVTAVDARRTGWEDWFVRHEVITVALVVFVAGCLVIPAVEWLSLGWDRSRRTRDSLRRRSSRARSAFAAGSEPEERSEAPDLRVSRRPGGLAEPRSDE